jgi:hypothetical protein
MCHRTSGWSHTPFIHLRGYPVRQATLTKVQQYQIDRVVYQSSLLVICGMRADLCTWASLRAALASP